MNEKAKPQTFRIETLGCRTNQYESQAYQDQLEALGYIKAADNEAADICVVNTCTVTESADTSSKQQLRQLAKRNPNAKIVVTGCSSERQPDLFREMEGVSLVVPNAEKASLINRFLPDQEVPEFNIKNFDSHTRAFIKVQDGCNSFCTYCIIPYVRGRSKSRTIDSVVAEVHELIHNGFKEIVLTGINVGDFDGNRSEGEKVDTLADLVRAVDNVPGLKRLRVSSIDPDEVNDDLADAIISGKTTCHSMHIVLQSGSNVVLKRMNRKYTRQIFLDTVQRLKVASPRFTFTTDIIVGFPGETEVDHHDTLDLMREVRFAKVHMFPYSDRPRTKASLMPNKVAHDVMHRRRQEVMRLSEQLAFQLRDDYLGQSLEILTESADRSHPGYISGHTENFLPVLIPAEGIGANELVHVFLEENTPAGFLGRIITKHSCSGTM